METCQYTTVETTPELKDDDNVISRKYLLRQTFVCSGTWAAYFCAGLCFGSPTVFIPQLRKEANSSEAVSIEMASWLSCAFNYSGMVSCIILAVLTNMIGRKRTFLMMCAVALLAFVLLYCSTTVNEILVCEILLGPLLANPVTLSIMVITEYTSPLYRGVFLTLKSATFLWGIWIANAIGTYMHWKNIVIVGFICSLYALTNASLWPESPYWLLHKNRFDDCAASFRWLKGCNKQSEAELKILIQSRKTEQSTRGKSLNFFRNIVKMLKTKSFYKPIIMSMLAQSLYNFSGKLACAMYALDIIKRITGTESTAYTGMIILDGITIVASYVGCGLSKILKRRTLLLASSVVGVIFLFLISFYLYLIHYEVISEDPIISMSLLIGYSLTISVGPMIMASTILGELIPLKYRSSATLLLGGYSNFLMGTLVKISPFIITSFGVRGFFLFFFVSESLLTVVTYKLLPETKDKTLLEIQSLFTEE